MPTAFDFGRRSYDPGHGRDRPLDAVVTDWFQHLVILQLRQEMEAGASSRKAVAALLGVVEGQFGRKLAGTQPLMLEDLTHLLTAFGPGLLPNFGDATELFPPSYRAHLAWDRRDGMGFPRLVDAQ